ncbi:MAG: YggT family protein, partial [Bacillota bacterium]|nr:YggT family protein [Bacillota bacterium]
PSPRPAAAPPRPGSLIRQIVNTVFRIYYVLLFINVILSWIRIGDNVFTRFIYEMTEPLLRLCRRILPPRPGFPLDFSPILAFIALEIAHRLLLRLLVIFL